MIDFQVPSERPPVCDYEGSEYQATFWDCGEREYEDRVEEIALRRLLAGHHGEPPLSGRLLELGAGAGRNTPRYSGFDQVVLLDYSMTQLQQAQERLGNSDRFLFVAADIYRLPFSAGLFDAATMIRTLHHMAEPRLALKQVRWTLRPGARFILEYANKQNLKSIARYLLRRQSWNPFSLEPVEFAALNFDFHPRAVRSLLNECDFSVQRQLTVSHFRMNFLKKYVPVEMLVGMDAIAQLSGNLWQLTPSVFVQAQAIGNSPSAERNSFFRCPECLGEILEAGDSLVACRNCGRRWLI